MHEIERKRKSFFLKKMIRNYLNQLKSMENNEKQ